MCAISAAELETRFGGREGRGNFVLKLVAEAQRVAFLAEILPVLSTIILLSAHPGVDKVRNTFNVGQSLNSHTFLN